MSITRPRQAAGELYCVVGPWCKPETHDEDCKTGGTPPAMAAKSPPTAIIHTFSGSGGGPLLMAWLNQDRTFDGGDSYVNRIGGGSGVSSYSWSVNGATIPGGSGGSSCTVHFGTLGTARVELTVTDNNGVEGQRRCYIRVVQRPHLAGAGQGPIRGAVLENLTGSLSGAGWGGYRGSILIRGPDADAIQYQRGQMVALYHENHYDGTLYAGEVFSGFVLGVEALDSGTISQVRLEIGTAEAFLGRTGVDCMDFGLLNDRLAEQVDIGIITLTMPRENYAWYLNWGYHWLPRLTVGLLLHHVLWKHIHVRIGTERFPATEVCNFVREWWTEWDVDGDDEVLAFNMPRGPAMAGLAAAFPSGAWAGFCDRHSALIAVRLQPGKPTADASGGSITRASCLSDIELLDGDDEPVRAVVVTPAPQSQPKSDVPIASVTYPSTPSSQGAIETPRLNVWVGTSAAAARIAEARFHILNATKGARVHLPGVRFTLHNVCQLTASGGRFTWTNKPFYVVAERVERGDFGMLRQWLELREVRGNEP